MKLLFSRYSGMAVVVGVLLLFGQLASAQTGILNPNDTVVTYNPASPPATPPANTLAKWVRTVDFNWNSTEYKCYYYNSLQFRIKFPKTYGQDPPGTVYPMYIFFHGVGERGSIYDNEMQLYHGGQYMMQSVDKGTFDGFLVYPQSSAASGGWSQAQINNVAALINNYFIPQVQVDPNRIVLNGLSGGGDAVWLFMQSFPNLAAAAIPMSSASTQDQALASSLLYTPIWMLTGGLDDNPSPYTSQQLNNVFSNAGGDLLWKLYSTLGHDTWDSTWEEPNYWPFLKAGNKTNPWTVGGKNLFCPGTSINATLGVTAGFTSYQWRQNGVPIPGANSNTLHVTSPGIYDVSLERGTTWSYYSPHPDTIGFMPPTVSPNIAVNGLQSDVLPAPNGQTTVSLTVPAGYATYTWENVGPPATQLSSTTNKLSNVGPGSYAVEVTQVNGCSTSFSNPFVVASASGPNPPGAVTGLTATVLGQTQVKLNWNESNSQTYPETNFEIYQSTSTTGPWKLIGFSAPQVDSFIATGLLPNSPYYFEVRPINATAAGPVTPFAGATTPKDLIPPTAPGGLTVTSTSQTSVSLSWNQSTDPVGVVEYDIYINGNKSYTIPVSSDNPDTTLTAYNLVNGTAYNFIVRAKDIAGNISPASNQLTAYAGFSGLNYTYYSLTTSPSVLPNFPTLTPTSTGNMPVPTVAHAPNTTNFAYLWNGYINIPVTGQYVFQTVSDDGSEVWLGGLGQTAFPYNFSGGPTLIVNANKLQGSTATNSATLTLQAGVYPISIGYFQAGGGYTMALNWKSPQSGGSFVAIPNNVFVQTFPATGTPPAIPTNLTATAVSSQKVVLSWQDTATNATGFQVFRSTSAGGPFVAVSTLPAGKFTYSDSTLTANTTYYYQVTAINSYGQSGYNGVPGGNLTVNYYQTGSLGSLPNFSTLTPTRTFSDTTFSINFSNAGVNWAATYTGYIIIPTTGSYTFATNSDDGSALYIDGKEVVNNDGAHAPQTVSGTVNLPAGVHTVQVQFFQAGGGQNLSAYIQGPGIANEIIPSSMLGLPPVNVTTMAAPVIPAAPSNLTGTVLGPNSVALSWIDNDTNAIRYQVWRSPVTDAAYSLVTTLTGNGITSYQDSSLTPSTVYYYKVLALNEGGSSAFSNEVSDTTTANPITTVTLAAIPTQNLYNDTTVAITLAAASNYGTVLTYTGSNLPAFATLTSSGNVATLTLAPNNAQLGTFTGTVTATDNYGGTVTDTFTVVVTGRNQDVTLLNINSQNPQAAPWNNMNANPTAGLTVGPLLDVNGNNTGVSIINLNQWSANRLGITTTNNNGVVPNNVSQTYYYGTSGVGYQMKLTGLNTQLRYALSFYAGFAWTAQYQAQGTLLTTYSCNGQSVTLNVAYDTTTWATLTNLAPDSTGSLLITISKPAGSVYEMLSAMQIISYTAPTGPLVLKTPASVTAYGTSTSQIKVNWTATGDAVSGYEIWRSTSPVGTYVLDGTAAAGATSFTDAGLPANATYFYEVREVADTLYSGFSSYAGGSTVAYTVNLNLNESSTYAESNGQWNNINTLTYNGFSLNNMTNTLGQQTGINFNVIKNFDGYNASVGLTTGKNSGVVPDTVMNKVYYENFGDSCSFSISGLSRASVYNLSFYGGTNYNYTTNTTYRVGNQLVNLNALNNTTQLATLYNLTPDTTGTITVWLGETAGYGFLNGLIVQGMTGPGTVAADSTGGGGIASYQSTHTAASIVSGSQFNNLDSTVTTSSLLLNVYPNPFTGEVMVVATFTQPVPKLALVLVDRTGRILQENEYTNIFQGTWRQAVQLKSDLPPGIYILEMIGVTGEKPRTFTLLKSKY